jgi:LysM repeat protein
MPTLNQRLVHFLVITMTMLLIFVNLNTRANANASGFIDRAHHTILAELVTSELGGFIEDEELIVETLDPSAIAAGTQQSYLDNLSSVRSQPKVSIKDELRNDDYIVAANIDGSIVHPNIVSTKITEQDRTETISYTILSGDTISVIAEKFGISVSTILWENDLSSYSIIRPGDSVNILPRTGISHTVIKNDTISSIVKKYDIKENELLELNKIAKGDNLKVGQKLFVPGGKKTIYKAPVPKTYTGFTAIKNIVSTPSSQVVSGNKMAWPTSATIITQYYSWRHHGLDIAQRGTVPIYAADSGTVESAGWGKGYGYNILIDHGGGKKTRYAHMSKFYISKGDKVSKGQTIGLMGNTGWSTGQHLHFEVIINGKKYNPLNYIR